MWRTIIIALMVAIAALPSVAQEYLPRYYDVGSPDVTDLYVDPVVGDDGNTGRSSAQPFRTLSAAWNEIPMKTPLTTGFRINLAPGTYPESSIPNYLESRHGTSNAPIIIRSAGPQGSALLGGDLNIFDCRYLYIIGVTIRPDPAGDAFHCERCDHLVLRGSTFDGGARAAHETVKINQSQYVFIENNNISGADDNALDFVAVQYGSLIGNRIHNAGDWCAYVKGGSAYLRVENNAFFDCGTGGFTAGQGTGFEFMVSPWLHYEAYDIKFFNNIVHDTEGAAVGVNGGYNIVMAFNTFYRVGSRSHGIEVVFGSRSCDGDTARCSAHRALGGWGPSAGEEPIPNHNVFILNNVLYNPEGFRSADQHFAVHPPRTPSGGSNIPAPARSDVNLVIRGNIILNGPSNLPLGIEGITGACDDANLTCNEAQLRAENTINIVEPRLINPTAGDFRPVTGGAIVDRTGTAIPDFTNEGRPVVPSVPVGIVGNSFLADRGGSLRNGSSPPGAYATADSPLVRPEDDAIAATPHDPTVNRRPRVTITAARIDRSRGRARAHLRARCTDIDGSITQVTGTIAGRGVQTKRFSLRKSGRQNYRGSVTVQAVGRPLNGTIIATDNSGASTTKRRRIRG